MRLSAATIVTRAMTVASRTKPIGSRTSNAQSLKDKVMRTTAQAYCRRFIDALQATSFTRAAA